MGNVSSGPPVDVEELRNFVNEAISSHKVVVFSKSHCPYCLSAKKLLKQFQRPVHVIELNDISYGSAIQRELSKKTGSHTVPQVFIDGKFIGGNDELQAFHKAGKLAPALEKAFGDASQS